MTDTRAVCCTLAGQYDWQVRRTTRTTSVIAGRDRGPVHRAADPPGPPVMRSPRWPAARRQQLRRPEPLHTGHGPCPVPATPVLSWTADPRGVLLHGLRQRGRVASPTSSSRRTPSQPRRTRMYSPALDNTASTYADNQAGQAYYWHIRPCRNPRNCGPDPMSETDVAQGSFTKRSPPSRVWASSDPSGSEITFSVGPTTASTNQEQPVGADRVSAVPRRRSSTGSRCDDASSTAPWWTARWSTSRPTPPPTGSIPKARSNGACRPSTPTTTAHLVPTKQV